MPYFLIFLLLPLVEIRLFGIVAGLIGPWPTVGLTLLSMVAGASLLRVQGWRMLLALRDPGADMSGRDVFDGICLAVAGFLFIVPGFFTDFLAILLLLPQTRTFAGRQVMRRAGVNPDRGQKPDKDIIEGDYERVEEE
jgi:UPF0716 protein FxsA